MFPIGPAAAIDEAQLRIAFDAWQPNTADCKQVVTFRLLPVDSEVPPTGTAVLSSDVGAEIGRIPISGFGSYSVQGVCAADDRHHQVSLHYSGDTAYAGQATLSPDLCSRTIVTDSQTTEFFSGGTPFFLCRTNYGHSPRALDGRLLTAFSTLSTIGGAVEYGSSMGMSYLFSDLAEHGAVPTSEVQHVIDGAVVATVTPEDAQRNSLAVDTRTLNVGKHTAGVAYPGDPRWAPSSKIYRFQVVKARPQGKLGVKDWQLRQGERPRMWFELRNPFDRLAVAPRGKVHIYVGNERVKTTRVSTDSRRTAVVLPPVGRMGTFRLRVVYQGDAKYRKLDSSTRHWSGGQFIRVS